MNLKPVQTITLPLTVVLCDEISQRGLIGQAFNKLGFSLSEARITLGHNDWSTLKVGNKGQLTVHESRSCTRRKLPDD